MKKSLCGVLGLVALLLAGCSAPLPYTTLEGTTEGTSLRIIYQSDRGDELQGKIQTLLERFDSSLSVYNPESLLSRVNRNDTTVRLDPWFVECFTLSRTISEHTDGAFDITVRPLITAYHIGEERNPTTISQPQVDSILAFTGYQKVRIEAGRVIKDDPRVQLDFNAIAKGYSVDLVAQLLENEGVSNYLVEIGGEIFCRGVNSKGKEWLVGVDRPFEGNMIPGQAMQASLRVSGYGLATSGNYRKYGYDEQGNRVTHTIDPKTGRPATHSLLSATIIAPTTAVADGYATACMVIGLERSKALLAAHPELEGYLIYTDANNQLQTYATPEMEKRIVP